MHTHRCTEHSLQTEWVIMNNNNNNNNNNGANNSSSLGVECFPNLGGWAEGCAYRRSVARTASSSRLCTPRSVLAPPAVRSGHSLRSCPGRVSRHALHPCVLGPKRLPTGASPVSSTDLEGDSRRDCGCHRKKKVENFCC